MKTASSPVLKRASDKSRSVAPVWIAGIGLAAPAEPVPQKKTLEFILSRFNINERTKQLYKRTLSNASIATRHFSLEKLDQVLDQDHDRKNARFESEAVRLSTESLTRALAAAGTSAHAIDFVVVTTCTGYICPGLSTRLVETLSLRPNVRTADLVGMGCGAAVPAIELAHNFLVANPEATAAVVCTEICTAAMVSNDEIDIVISNTIFADGSAALLLTNASRAENGDPAPHVRAFNSLLIPEWRDTLRFRSDQGHLKNVLGKNVPEQAARAMKIISEGLCSPDHWILHAGGAKVLDAIEAHLALAPDRLLTSRSVLKKYGNMSSPTVLFVLDEFMKQRSPRRNERALLGSFGAGFSAYGAMLEWI